MSAIPQITQITKEKAESAKAFIEKKYQKLKCDEKERKEGKFKLQLDKIYYSFLSLLMILIAWDMLSKKMAKLNLSDAE